MSEAQTPATLQDVGARLQRKPSAGEIHLAIWEGLNAGMSRPEVMAALGMDVRDKGHCAQYGRWRSGT